MLNWYFGESKLEFDISIKFCIGVCVWWVWKMYGWIKRLLGEFIFIVFWWI